MTTTVIKYVVYDLATGEIRSRCQGTEASMVAELLAPGVGVLRGDADPATQVVDVSTKSLVAKQPSPGALDRNVANRGDAVYLADLPESCLIRIEDDTYVVDDGEAVLSFEFAGAYTMTVYADGYLPRQHTVVIA